MELIANSILNLLAEHRYIFSFLGALTEGAYSLVLVGVLFKFGYFNFWGLFILLVVGYYLNGIAYYMVGRFGGHKILEKYGKKLRITKNLLEKLENYFKKYSTKALFFTRITYGISVPTLIVAGAFKMKWKKFLVVSFFASVVWIILTLAIGYIFGISYEAVGSMSKKIAKGLTIVLFVIVIPLSIVILVWLQKIIKVRFLKNKLIKNFNNEDKKGNEN